MHDCTTLSAILPFIWNIVLQRIGLPYKMTKFHIMQIRYRLYNNTKNYDVIKMKNISPKTIYTINTWNHSNKSL